MNFNEELSVRTSEVEEIIIKFLPKEKGEQATVIEAMNYSFLSGGKRLRPMMLYETYKMFGGTSKVVEPFMASIEMIHTYSLIHDDLPAMDNDKYRRGKYTTHVVYGEAMAILAGDALLNYAYETAISALFMEPEHDQNQVEALSILTKHAGIYGMVGGQAVDVENDGKPLKKGTLDFIYELKTGALIEAAMLIGAVLAGASESKQRIISKIASNIGIAFQIQDDILDITSSASTLGKPIGSDVRNRKTTYVTLEGIDKARADVRRLTEEAVALMDTLPQKDPFLKELLLSLISRVK